MGPVVHELWLSPDEVARLDARLEAQRAAAAELDARLLEEWAAELEQLELAA